MMIDLNELYKKYQNYMKLSFQFLSTVKLMGVQGTLRLGRALNLKLMSLYDFEWYMKSMWLVL